MDGLDAVAHRIVHGGSTIAQPMIVDDGCSTRSSKRRSLRRYITRRRWPQSAPSAALLPGVPEMVIADTAFHQNLAAARLDLRDSQRSWPRAMASAAYGFHGIGHSYMMDRYAEISGKPAHELDLITLQLGAGCSISAIAKGRSVDTSMGLTPLEGLVMATRSGDIDPAIPGFIAAHEGLSTAAVEQVLNTKSGLLGVSGISSDMREIEAAAARGDQRRSPGDRNFLLPRAQVHRILSGGAGPSRCDHLRRRNR